MRRIGEKKKQPKVDPKPDPIAKPTQPKIDQTAKAQVEATLALTEIAASAINNPQITQMLSLLTQQSEPQPTTNKRLKINRDNNGLIESIDIQII